ncbi:box C D snoRNA 1 [Chlorella sorokiniana]|uniref:Box C/D snoRNA protein 1 n=1 Tax=Chlorella sorokiniana TaxID=3076 RepID=A0A2P6U0Y1_CHLSO|nr:box C D snoRNA 1 [Chlorella sorokiniana]|eukprot:PRW59975.1 box C D snoRNA 1 [Chlorella sorokiniana]
MASREQQAGLQPPAQSDQAQGSACQVCGKAAAKYCCPRCDRRTCSLDCVKAHKEATGCSGKRDRTAFVGRGAFDERTFLSDYRFLEEVKLADDVAKRSKPPAPKPELPQFLQTLQYQARRRGVQLHILSPGMEKRRTNSTRYDGRMQTLYWHVEWSFPAAGCKATDTKVHENTPIAQLLAGHLALQPGAAAKHHALREYREAGQEQLTVLLRKERTPANAAEYYEVDEGRPLRQQLAGKVLVEFPTLLVLLPAERDQYIILPAAATAAAGAAAAGAALAAVLAAAAADAARLQSAAGGAAGT